MSRQIITTVLTPYPAIDLISLDDFKDDWGIDTVNDDTFIARAITRCSRAAANFLNRTLGVETVQDEIALHRDQWPFSVHDRPERLQLSRWPIVAVTSVTVDGIALVEGTDFLTDAASGQLERLDISGNAKAWCGSTVIVVYSAGFNLPGQAKVTGAQDLPDDIEDAVSRMAYTRYAERRRDPLVKSEYVDGVGRQEYIVPTSDGNLSPDVEDLLDNYRIKVIG